MNIFRIFKYSVLAEIASVLRFVLKCTALLFYSMYTAIIMGNHLDTYVIITEYTSEYIDIYTA